ncbi:MAG TPA: CHAT domain-containing protein [Bryobacteraceae bacterium]
MRVVVWLAVAGLAGCGHGRRSLADEPETIRRLLQSERYDVAQTRANDDLSQARQTGDLKLEWRFRLLKAEVLVARRDAAAALHELDQQPPAGPDWAEYRGKALLLRGHSAYLLSRYEEAERLIAQAADEAHQSGSAFLEAEVNLRRGFLQVRQGHFQNAEELFRSVIAAANHLQDSYLEASAIGNLGYELLQASRYDEAIVWFEKAKGLFTRLDARESIARVSGNLGWCYFRLGNLDNARSQFNAAEAEFVKTGNRYEQQAWLGNAGSVAATAGDYVTAVADYQQALAIARQLPNDFLVSQWLSNLAECLIAQGDLTQAEKYNNEALRLQHLFPGSRSEVYPLGHAARIAALRRQFTEAEELYSKALALPANDPTVILDSLTGLADVYAQTGRKPQAKHQYELALESVDHRSSTLLKDEYRFSYLDSVNRFYRQYVDFLMAIHEPSAALEIAESSRSHVLAARSGAIGRMQSHTADAYKKLAQQSGATLVEYWLGADRSYLWVITPQRIREYPMPPAKDIRPLVESYRRIVMGQRNPMEVASETGRKLFQDLLAPVADDLCPHCRVVLVPDQELYSLNFEMLPAAADSSEFWLERATVAIAPSLDYLIESRRRSPNPGKGLLVLGDPASSLPEFPKLEFSALEIDSVRSSMAGRETKVFRGPTAVPPAYVGAQPGRFGFIHFSAHATANTQSPLDSAVILSGPPDRCRLFARDVMSVPLTAELVTISACRSAGARTYAGEGLVGFAWAFLRAGARNVIAGLWDVNDRSTEELMSRLYAEVARGAAPAEALRAAKLSFIHAGGSYAKPFYWAPFQVFTGALN